MYKNIETKNLYYRFFKPEDLPFLNQLLGDDSVCKYLSSEKAYPEPVIKRVLDMYVEANDRDHNQHIYIVYEKGNDKPIGYAGIQMVVEFKRYEIFYAFIPEAWNKGYGTEASLKMKEVAKEIGLKNLVGLADTRNIGSQRVLEKTGYIKKDQFYLWGLNLYFYEMEI